MRARKRSRSSAVILAVAVFVSGGVLLGVEITASRVLAPSFGSSLYVWGALIGVVLTGLAIGYWVGGVVADRYPVPLLLVGVISLGALLVLAIPYAESWVIRAVVGWDLGARLDPLLAAILLFGPASVVLAAVSPIAVRLAARSLDRLGRVAGRLFSISTAGSIAGTFATAFWLVPELGTNQVLATGAVGLLVAALIVAVQERLALPSLALFPALAAAVVALVSLAPDQGGTVQAEELRNYSPLYRLREERTPRLLDAASVADMTGGLTVREARETRYHRLLVVDSDDSRFLRFDSSFQSGMYLDDPYRTRYRYTDYLQLPLAYHSGARRVLFIGLGGASAPKRMWRDFPQLTFEAVELDPDVVAAAYRWFSLPRDPRLRVTVQDGRLFLAGDERRWDVIAIDAFYADAIPFHLSTLEFVELARRRLTPGGVIAVNIIGAIAGDYSRLLRSMAKTYAAVFPTVVLHPVTEGPRDADPRLTGNIILLATDRPAPSEAFLERRWEEIRKASPRAVDLRVPIRRRWPHPLQLDDVPLLTDDYAPTDALLIE